MTLRQGLLRAARRAPRLLGDATERVTAFVRGQACRDGGYRGRSEAGDLYYSVFALDSLSALDAPTEEVAPFLEGFGDGEGLDLVHLSCLARCWAHAGVPPSRGALLTRLDGFRSPDGGWGQEPGATHGSAYGAFLAIGAREDLAAEGDGDVAPSLLALRTKDGGFANQPGSAVGSTPATAAAVTLLCHLGQDVDASAGDWLLTRCEGGGFKASQAAPISDLLSTATSLHALAALGRPLDEIREACLDFLDARWDPAGGFSGSALDPVIDVEYTFYGLLALGHLAT